MNVQQLVTSSSSSSSAARQFSIPTGEKVSITDVGQTGFHGNEPSDPDLLHFIILFCLLEKLAEVKYPPVSTPSSCTDHVLDHSSIHGTLTLKNHNLNGIKPENVSQDRR